MANIIDGDIQLCVFCHIQDNFHCVAEWCLTVCQNHQESTLLQTYLKQTQLTYLGANNFEQGNTFDLIPEDLITK